MPPRLAAIKPMLLDTRKYAPFSHADWLFEIKYDGYRMLAEFGAGEVRMNTRKGIDCTRWFPEVEHALSRYTGGPFIVDGEVCVLDELGRSDFDRLQDRARRQCFYPECDRVVFCMFDMLVLGGKDIMGEPLFARKSFLKALFTPKPKHDLLVVDAVPEAGLELYAMAVELKLEGLCAKQMHSIYTPGERSTFWRKLKRPGAVPPERFKRR